MTLVFSSRLSFSSESRAKGGTAMTEALSCSGVTGEVCMIFDGCFLHLVQMFKRVVVCAEGESIFGRPILPTFVAPLQGLGIENDSDPGRCPGLTGSAPLGREDRPGGSFWDGLGGFLWGGRRAWWFLPPSLLWRTSPGRGI